MVTTTLKTQTDGLFLTFQWKKNTI